ncbi:MAG: DUF4037 domain-containing protein [Candidatus Paceibacterota bacterium]
MKVTKTKNDRMILYNYLTVAKKVAKLFSDLQNVVAVVIGGSLARGFYDNYSDIEMYVYYDQKIPTKAEISDILKKLNSKLNRSKKIFWFHKAWGHHTFFMVDGIKIELGYREIGETQARMESFLNEFSLPKHGIHDTPFGHYESGVANCILECIPLYTKGDWISKIREKIRIYPIKLKKDNLRYYYQDAKTITKIKIKNAIHRNDTLLFNACLAKVIRSMNLCLFALNDVYYPGDKWNHKYISKFAAIPTDYLIKIDSILAMDCTLLKNKKVIYNNLNMIISSIHDLIQATIEA